MCANHQHGHAGWKIALVMLTALALIGCGPSAHGGSDNAASPTDAVSIGAGFSLSCLTRVDGSVWCWGSSTTLGGGQLASSPTDPVRVASPVSLAFVAVGENHACATAMDRTVWCWGSNAGGGLGVEGVADSASPIAVPGVAGVVQLAAGSGTCAVLAARDVVCWGRSTTDRIDGPSAPRRIAGVSDVVDISMSADEACAVVADGRIWCWSVGGDPQVPLRATVLEGLDDAVDISLGLWHACAVLRTGHVRCWGEDSQHGRLGDGNRIEEPQPGIVDVVDITNAASISVSEGHTCALLRDARLACWGYNKRGQIGDGTTTSAIRPYVQAANPPFATIETGTVSTCTILEDGTPMCWGEYRSVYGATDATVRPVTIRTPR